MRKKYGKISYESRKILEQMCREGYGITRIAKELNVNRDTIYKEFSRSGMTRENYKAEIAQAGR